jgi:hypothetical protein
MWLGLVAMDFPPSVIPLVLLVGAVAIDLAVTLRLPGWLAGPLVAAVFYLAGAGQDAIGFLPPWDWSPVAVLLTGVVFTALWTAVDGVARSRWLAAWARPVEPGREDGPEAVLGAVGGGTPTR